MGRLNSRHNRPRSQSTTSRFILAHLGLFWQGLCLIVLNRDKSGRDKVTKTGGVETLLKKHRERVEFCCVEAIYTNSYLSKYECPFCYWVLAWVFFFKPANNGLYVCRCGFGYVAFTYLYSPKIIPNTSLTLP